VGNTKKSLGIIVGILLLILPWRYLSSLALGETTFTIARNFLPFTLITVWSSLRNRGRKQAVISILAISFLLLINTSILAILVVGISGLILALSFRKGKIKRVLKYIKQTLIIILAGLTIVTLWYTPSYWIIILTNPSIGGASGFKVILRLFDLLRASAPLFLAIFAVYFSGKVKSRLIVFGLTWTLTFLFLTAFRFIGDPDFWQDWTSWLYEIEVGIAFLVSKPLLATFARFRKKEATSLIVLITPFLLTFYVSGLLGKPRLISNSVPEGVRSLEKLAEIAGNERVFLSGSTVFWANALTGLRQVRGGVDKVAIHPFWDHAAYQLREGDDPRLAKAWLEALGVSHVLMHGPYSLEAYHDFRNIDKWLRVGEIVWEGQGDVIIKVPEASLAWVVDLNRLENVPSPKSGTDLNALKLYLSARKRLVNLVWDGPNRLLVKSGKLNENEGVILAISFNSGWKTEDNASLKKDPLGNTLIIPKNLTKTSLKLQYR